MSAECSATMLSDGRSTFTITLTAKNVCVLRDIRLEIPLNKESAKRYLNLGGHDGSPLPPSLTWNWSTASDSFWIGDAFAGLHCKLLGSSYDGPIPMAYSVVKPLSWYNSGSQG